MTKVQKERILYLLLALAITVSVFWGFTYTYLGARIVGDPVSDLPTAVHIHGISFFAWYALLSVQAILVVARPITLHRWLGYCSVPLAILMVTTGLLVLGVRIEGGLSGNDPFWAVMSLMIFSNLILCSVFYALAILKRAQPDQHRRFIIVAAATGSGAAAFRILVNVFEPSLYLAPAGILVTNLFLLAGAIGDKIVLGKVHRVYVYAIPIAIVTECALLGLSFLEFGVELQRFLVEFLRPFFWLY